MNKFDTKKLVGVAILVALNVVFTRFVSIRTPIVRIGLNFIVIAVTSALYGPLTSGMANVAADLIGSLISPSGAFFPGFTLSAFITGFVYGVFFHNKEITLPRIIAACAINSLGVSLILNTTWLTFITGSDFASFLSVRIPQALFSFAFHVIVLRLILNKLVKSTKKYLVK